MTSKRISENGFSLVEIAIVLIIIGLIAGSILLGQHIINGAKIKRTIAQMRNYETAVNLFSIKYHGIPGDIRMAVDFGFDAVTSTEKGNGLLTADESNDENMKFWRHLSQASLIDGNYDGTTTVYGEGAPHTELNHVGIYAAGQLSIFPGRNIFAVGLDEISSTTYHLTPEQAWQLDRKSDDGLPTNGLIRAPNAGFSPFCYITGTPDEYNLTFETGLCALFVRMSF